MVTKQKNKYSEFKWEINKYRMKESNGTYYTKTKRLCYSFSKIKKTYHFHQSV